MTYWEKRTNKGAVVYKRPRHFWDTAALLRVVTNIDEEMPGGLKQDTSDEVEKTREILGMPQQELFEALSKRTSDLEELVDRNFRKFLALSKHVHELMEVIIEEFEADFKKTTWQRLLRILGLLD